MTRQLQNTSQSVQTQIDSSRSERTRRAYLVYPYRDGQLTTVVTFTDPRNLTMGAAVQARISAGFTGPSNAFALPSLEAGYPVTVVVRRGQVVVVGF